MNTVQYNTIQALTKNHYPSSTVYQHKPPTPFPHPQFPSFYKSQLTSPAHNLVTPPFPSFLPANFAA